MTRLNNDLRENLHRNIMKNLPVRNFINEIHTLIQEEVIKHAPKQVQELFSDENKREYIAQHYVEVRLGNKSVPLYSSSSEYIYGLNNRMNIRMDDAEYPDRLPDGSLYKIIVTRLANEGLVKGYYDQEDLRVSVSKRLRANLNAASSIKKLYDILEPELHHYIPKDTAKASLPACVAPVLDDLKKLGLVVP